MLELGTLNREHQLIIAPNPLTPSLTLVNTRDVSFGQSFMYNRGNFLDPDVLLETPQAYRELICLLQYQVEQLTPAVDAVAGTYTDAGSLFLADIAANLEIKSIDFFRDLGAFGAFNHQNGSRPKRCAILSFQLERAETTFFYARQLLEQGIKVPAILTVSLMDVPQIHNLFGKLDIPIKPLTTYQSILYDPLFDNQFGTIVGEQMRKRHSRAQKWFNLCNQLTTAQTAISLPKINGPFID